MTPQEEVNSMLEELKQEITAKGGNGDFFVEVWLRSEMNRLQERVDSKGEGWVCYPFDSTLKYTSIQRHLSALVPPETQNLPENIDQPLTKLVEKVGRRASHNIQEIFKICGCWQDP